MTAKKKAKQTGLKVHCSHDKMVSVDELVPNPRNPNEHPKKQIELLAKIIKRQGWRHPITVSNRSGFVSHGHGRLEAALLMGVEKVPVDYQDYENEAQEWEDLLADNKIAELAKLSKDKASELIKEIDEQGGDLEMTAFSDSDLQKLLEFEAKSQPEPPEVEFTEELMESSNYIVLYFKNDVDWLQAQTLFELKTVKALDSRDGYEKQGIGRVIDGAAAINKLIGEE